MLPLNNELELLTQRIKIILHPKFAFSKGKNPFERGCLDFY